MKKSLKRTTAILLGFGLLSVASAADGEIKINGSIQTQGSKALYDNNSESDFDGFWIRGNLGVKYTTDDFEALVNFRMWSTAFNGETEIVTPQIYYGHYKWALEQNKFNLKFGHWETDWSIGGNFGTYLDKKIGSHGFMGRGSVNQDGVELGWTFGPSNLNAMIATTYDADDANSKTPFNRGYLRLEDNLKLGKPMELTLAYRVNALDPMLKPAVITHRAGLKAAYTIFPSLKLYGELGYINTGKDDEVKKDTNGTWTSSVKPEYTQDTDYLPFYIGLEVPTAGILSNLMFEVEYIRDREELVAGSDELAWSVAAVKKLGRTKIQLSLFSEKEISDPAVAFRVTTSL